MFLSDEGPTLQTLDFTFHIGSTPTLLYFDLYLEGLKSEQAYVQKCHFEKNEFKSLITAKNSEHRA